jgi:DnaK suppressor protein
MRNASETPKEIGNPDDLALSDVVDDIDLALVSLETETLEKIDDALDRLAAGEYGYCTDCGQEIPARRLDALPFVNRCRSCEEASELRRDPRHAAVAHHHPACLS